MVITTVHPAGPPPAVTAVALRGQVGDLVEQWERGTWVPTVLERRIATLLSLASAGDGLLTADRVRHALWEGALTLHQENGGRLGALLSELLSALDRPKAADVPDDHRAEAAGTEAVWKAAPYGHLPYADGPLAEAVGDACRFLDAMARGHASA